ncbi:MAG TPA: alpha/beta hydrolase [Geobacteraceae bacterium]|nr:alpha/beta hydrolase [Geobacteraceae bacterium]
MVHLIKIALIFFILLLVVLIVLQRRLLYYPSHRSETNGLSEWTIDGRLIGCARKVQKPVNIWLFIHGNAGQAADRVYALPCFSDSDSVFILEYPGYGKRKGSPGMASFNSAAAEAYLWLRKEYPDIPVCVFGESIGSGPASSLAVQKKPPDKLVLVAPFDNLASVARDHLLLIPVWLLLLDRWDNVAALRGYSGKVEIYGAINDDVIPIRHARVLAASIPVAVFHEIPGGHNDWPLSGQVRIRN